MVAVSTVDNPLPAADSAIDAAVPDPALAIQHRCASLGVTAQRLTHQQPQKSLPRAVVPSFSHLA